MNTINTAKMKKILKVSLWTILALLVGFLLLAYIGAECGLEFAKEILAYINDKYSIVIGSANIGAAVALLRFVSVLQQKNDTTTAQLTESLSDIENKSANTISALSEGLNEIKGATALLQSHPRKMELLEKANDELKERLATITDLLLYFVIPNSENKTLDELRIAFGQSNLLKNVRALQQIAESAPEESAVKEDAYQAIKAAKGAISTIKKKVSI
jgi:hypothetical protein